MEDKARKQKICSDPKCREDWEELGERCAGKAMDFSYCPFCAEELSIHCSVCHETLADTSYQYCPWCGKGFE